MLVEMRVGADVVLAVFHVAGALCGVLGLLGALQALPAVAVMTSAVVQSTGKLAEFAVLVVVILALAATTLYNGVIADERLTLPAHLTSFMLLSTIHGVFCQSCMHRVPRPAVKPLNIGSCLVYTRNLIVIYERS